MGQLLVVTNGYERLPFSLNVNYGFIVVRSAVVPTSRCDTAILSCFGSGEHATEDNVRLTLNSYLDELEMQVGGNWLRRQW